MARIRIALLGGLDVMAASGEHLALPSKKAQGLLAYLACKPGQFHLRDALATLLWGDASDARARHSLRQALTDLRRATSAVAPALLLDSSEGIALDPATVEVDVPRFVALGEQGEPAALEDAAALYRGNLLAGIRVGEPAFEDWLLGQRERLRELAVSVHARLLAHQMKSGPAERAIQTAVALLALDPVQEPVHRMLMRLYARQGRRGAALRQYQLCVGDLARELGVEPEDDTKRLYQEILQSGAAAAAVPAEPTSETRVVGRAAELERLRQVLDEALRGEGRAVALLGEAGIGKSRLVAEIVASARARGAGVLLGHAYESQQILPLGPWVDAIRAAGILRTQADVAQRRKELARLFPELGTTRPTAMPAAQDYLRLFEALAQLLAALAAGRPHVVVVEDLHWADEMSVRFLSFLSRRVSRWPVLLVVTAREEELPDVPLVQRVLAELDRDGRLVKLQLPPLSLVDTSALVATLARHGTDAATLAGLSERIWNLSEGNPFTVVETMRGLRETGPVENAVLPPRVRDTIVARLERLSQDGQALAAVAAVVGRACDFTLLREAADMAPPRAARAVEELVARRVLHVEGEQLDFTHDRLRTVAYERLLRPRSQVLHRAVADALEKLHGPRLDEVRDQLATHYARAGLTEQAVDHLVQVAEKAARVYAYQQAADAFGRAADHLRPLGGLAADRRVLELTLRRSLYLSILGRFGEISELLARERARLDRVGEPALVGPYFFRLSLTHQNLGRFAEAAEHAERALAAGREQGDDVTMGKAHYVLALAYYYLGRLREGVEHTQAAIPRLRAPSETHWLGLTHWIAGMLRTAIGEFDEALVSTGAAAAIGDATADPRLQSFAAWVSCMALSGRGEHAAAIASGRRARELAMDPLSSVLGTGWLGSAHLQAGDAATAIPLLEAAVVDLQRMGLRHAAGRQAAFLAEALLVTGERKQARERAHEALALCRDTKFGLGIALAERALARVVAASGEEAEARRHLENALERFVDVGAEADAALTRRLLAQVGTTRLSA
jgi:DNA-binding SARP family transcriptional activator